jgi:hypothetical protein
MSGIPNQSVFGEIKREMQGQTKLDNSEVTGKVSRPIRDDITQRLSHFGGDFFQLVVREAFQVAGGTDLREVLECHTNLTIQ